MSTPRVTRDRKMTSRVLLHLGEPLQQDPTLPLYSQEITCRHVGRDHKLGWLIERAYDSSYPARFEVMRLGGSSWSFHDTQQQAIDGAMLLGEAYLDALDRSRRDGTGGVMFAQLDHPRRHAQDLRSLDRIPDISLTSVLRGERAAAADNIRRILSATGDEAELREKLEAYAARLAGQD